MSDTRQPYVCPAELAGTLDNKLRRFLHKPERILSGIVMPGMSVMDLGCGPGYFTMELSGLVGSKGRVVAADLQQKMLEIMSEKAGQMGCEKNIETHLCHTESIGYQGNVDFILAFWMVHEVPDQNKLFAELKTILNPGGKVLIVEPKWHVTSRAFSAMLQKAEDAGFRVVDKPKISISRALLMTLE